LRKKAKKRKSQILREKELESGFFDVIFICCLKKTGVVAKFFREKVL